MPLIKKHVLLLLTPVMAVFVNSLFNELQGFFPGPVYFAHCQETASFNQYTITDQFLEEKDSAHPQFFHEMEFVYPDDELESENSLQEKLSREEQGNKKEPKKKTAQKRQAEQKLPGEVEVEHHIIFVGPEVPKRPGLKGQGFLFLGMIMLALCLSAIRNQPHTEKQSFFEGVASSVNNLSKFERIPQSVFVLMLAVSSPFLMAMGARKLYKTLPAYLSWAKIHDEMHLSQLALIALYSCFVVINAGSLRR